MLKIKYYLLAFLLLPLAFCYGNDCPKTIADDLNENCIESYCYLSGGENIFLYRRTGSSLGIGKRYHNHRKSLGYGYSLISNFPHPFSFSAKGELLRYFKHGKYIGVQVGAACGYVYKDSRRYRYRISNSDKHWTVWPTLGLIIFGKEFELDSGRKNFYQFSFQTSELTVGIAFEYGMAF